MPNRPAGSATPALSETSVNVPSPLLWNSESPGAGQPARAALHREALVLAGLAFAELRQRVEPHVDVVGHEQIEPAVVVVVGKRRAGGPSRIADAGFLR